LQPQKYNQTDNDPTTPNSPTQQLESEQNINPKSSKLQMDPEIEQALGAGGCLLAELEIVLGGEGALVGVEIHLDVAHAGHDEHRHLRNLSASALSCRTAGRRYLGKTRRRTG